MEFSIPDETPRIHSDPPQWSVMDSYFFSVWFDVKSNTIIYISHIPKFNIKKVKVKNLSQYKGVGRVHPGVFTFFFVSIFKITPKSRSVKFPNKGCQWDVCNFPQVVSWRSWLLHWLQLFISTYIIYIIYLYIWNNEMYVFQSKK